MKKRKRRSQSKPESVLRYHIAANQRRIKRLNAVVGVLEDYKAEIQARKDLERQRCEADAAFRIKYHELRLGGL